MTAMRLLGSQKMSVLRDYRCCFCCISANFLTCFHFVAMYVHPELILDDELRVELVGEEEAEPKDQKPTKDDDDGFI